MIKRCRRASYGVSRENKLSDASRLQIIHIIVERESEGQEFRYPLPPACLRGEGRLSTGSWLFERGSANKPRLAGHRDQVDAVAVAIRVWNVVAKMGPIH